MGKSTMSMAIFNSYVKLPEGNKGQHPQMAEQFSLVKYECYPDLETINQKRHTELSDMFSGFLTSLLGCLCIHGLYRGRGPQVGDLASASSRAMVVVWCDVSIDEAWPREKHTKKPAKCTPPEEWQVLGSKYGKLQEENTTWKRKQDTPPCWANMCNCQSYKSICLTEHARLQWRSSCSSQEKSGYLSFRAAQMMTIERVLWSLGMHYCSVSMWLCCSSTFLWK